MNLSVSTILRIPSTVAWDTLLRKDTFLFITRGAMRYSGAQDWPDRLMETGVEIETTAWPLSIPPGNNHTFKIVNVDSEKMLIQTEEYGGLIKGWNHTMTVVPITGTTCRYTDQVEIHAGIVTPVVWVLANLFYRFRQSRWRTLAMTLGYNK